jgi:carbon-monoxide dehydrogenase large subunit
VTNDPAPHIGRPRPRVEDDPLLRGQGRYIADIAPAGTLYAAFLRSPVGHGRIESLDTSAATRMDGVTAVLTAAEIDLPPLRPAVENPDAWSPPRALLADALVRFAGEAIAVAIADDPYLAEDAIEAIELDIEPLPVIADTRAALAEGAPVLHADRGDNVLYDFGFDSGGVDEAFARAAVVIEREFDNPRYSAAPMEGRGVVAAPEGDGVVVWSSTQGPHRLATLLAERLGIDSSDIRVVCPDIGGAFGQKAHVYPEEILAAWLARKLQRPVRWIEDRIENLLAGSHARDQRVSVRFAADENGRLLAAEADVICDQGAYGVFPHGHILEALGTPAMIPGPYHLSQYRYRSRSVATNKAPEGAYRGVGLPVAALVHERMMDLLAAELGIDRAEIRRRNLIASDELPHTTLTHQRYDSGDYQRALEMALAAIDNDRFEKSPAEARAEGRRIGLRIGSNDG